MINSHSKKLLFSVSIAVFLSQSLDAGEILVRYKTGETGVLEVIGVVGQSVRLENPKSKNIRNFPLKDFDEGTLIRIISDLGKRLESNSFPVGDIPTVTLDRLEIFPGKYYGKKVRFSAAQFLSVNSYGYDIVLDDTVKGGREKNVAFCFYDSEGEIYHLGVADKRKFAEVLLNIPQWTKVDFCATVLKIKDPYESKEDAEYVPFLYLEYIKNTKQDKPTLISDKSLAAEKILVRSKTGYSRMLEVIGIVGQSVRLKSPETDEVKPFLLKTLDEDTLIRISADLSKQLKANLLRTSTTKPVPVDAIPTVTLARLKVFPEKYIGKKVRFKSAILTDIKASDASTLDYVDGQGRAVSVEDSLLNKAGRKRYLSFDFRDSTGEASQWCIADKKKFAEMLLDIPKSAKVEIHVRVFEVKRFFEKEVLYLDLEYIKKMK